MKNELQTIDAQNLQDKIHTIRGLQVMLDRDLAELYDVETKALNQAVKRNIDRFPTDFMFQLSHEEFENWRLQFVTSNADDSLRSQNVTLENGRGKHRKYLPYVFTEQGVSMLSAVLKSDIAVDISVKIIRAFVEMRKFIGSNSLLFSKMEALEKRQIIYELKTDAKIEQVLHALEDKTKKPDEGIFYDGQIYDAYDFVNDLLKSAKNEAVLIDNYIDESVFTLFSKYPNLKIKICHIGASLKDLGKKWFAFSKFEMGALEVLGRLK